ncbi:isochorismatase family protein [Azospirillum brasilense]|uniref:Isochorismatase family protein n=1 Tax=Azospirillum brasilense TaxID=192 RepID=A0A6L3AX19_AZOBR|nr:isochorismatase family protein [Azospirillum brasilense]KAA0683137.1 isochorismatase family protein [Azospirillum brasilense]
MLDLLTRSDEALDIIRRTFPVALGDYAMPAGGTGLVIIDEVKGFAAVGCGPLAPAAPNAQVDRMIAETDRLARRFAGAGWPICVSLDRHAPDKPEPPYLPHCLVGTGHDELVSELAWLESEPSATLIAKDCINFFIGATETDGAGKAGRNRLVDWVNGNRLVSVVTVGICTDVCVMDFVLTLLSARNHGMMPTLKDVVVYEPGCATYDLPGETAQDLGLPETAAHPQEPAHHMGLYMMASRGALLADTLR